MTGSPQNSTNQRLPSNPRVRICYAGTYERAYPRNKLIIEAFRAAGAKVEEAHVPVFQRLQDKSHLSPAVVVFLAVRLVLAYLRLVPELSVRLIRCEALAIGYIGQLDMLILGLLGRALQKPVIFNPLVTLTDTVVDDRRMFNAGSLSASLIRRFDVLALRIATWIITDTEPNAAFLHEQMEVPEGKIFVVPVGADVSIFHPGKQLIQAEKLDVLFYGKFIPLHGVETIVRAAAILNKQDRPVSFELVGTGQEHERAIALAAALGVQNVTWVNWIPFSELGDRIRRADIVLGIFSSGLKADRVVPNKVYQAMACGRPVLTRESPAMDWLLDDENAAILVPPEDPEALANAIIRLDDEQLRDQVGKKGYRSWQMKASIPALSKSLAPLMGKLNREGLPNSQDT